jgi:hypothetical protein
LNIATKITINQELNVVTIYYVLNIEFKQYLVRPEEKIRLPAFAGV